jgi:electron transfer flavoprotein alpha/beta subunit
MEILVCMKQVPDEGAEIKLDPQTGRPDLTEIDQKENAFDAYALELAVRYIESHGGSISVTSVGSEADALCLRNGLSVGAQKAYLIKEEKEEQEDADTVAEKIAKALPELEKQNGANYDLILCGRESTDHIGGQVGAILAQKLGYAYSSDIVEAEPLADGIKVKKELEEGHAFLEVKLPAVLSISKPDYDPRYPNVVKRIASRKAEIPEIMAELSEKKVEYLSFSQPPKRHAGRKIQESAAETAVEKAMQQLIEDKVL